MLPEQRRQQKAKKLQVNALIVVDKSLQDRVVNSNQFVREFFPIVNYLLESVRIWINISDILLEDNRSFGFIEPLDEKHGTPTLNRPTPALLWEMQKRDQNFDIVLMLTGLDICEKTESSDRPFSCSLAGMAAGSQLVRMSRFWRKHVCTNRAAVVEVQNINDTFAKWSSVVAAAHEVVHLIGNTRHDGDADDFGGGPGGQDCSEKNEYLMAPSVGFDQLYRICKKQELWSGCTLQQIEHFTANWSNFCPGTFFVHEYVLYGCFIALVLDLAFLGVVIYNWRKRRSYNIKKAMEMDSKSSWRKRRSYNIKKALEMESMLPKEMVTGLSYIRDPSDCASSSSSSTSTLSSSSSSSSSSISSSLSSFSSSPSLVI